MGIVTWMEEQRGRRTLPYLGPVDLGVAALEDKAEPGVLVPVEWCREAAGIAVFYEP